ncbi:hypothetical protein CDV31_001255 [Fusarium ambrosium]|uniref:Uncharacterized protein n=1 Tax=Fusarium ambrosium TaxID=131363 RepID=A0A428V086_9HYPO|nr:hypothetical protein CDV31_001255 [Fusarium ambrosium]
MSSGRWMFHSDRWVMMEVMSGIRGPSWTEGIDLIMLRAMTLVPAGTSVGPDGSNLRLGVVPEVMGRRRMRQGGRISAESVGRRCVCQGSWVFAESMGG